MSEDNGAVPSFSFSKSLDLKPWNEAMVPRTPASARRLNTPSKMPWRLVGTPLRNPLQTPVAAKTPRWTAQKANTKEQAEGDAETPGPLKTTSLANLPNATQAVFWLRRAQNLAISDTKAAIESLQEGLRRNAQPVSELARALAELETADKTTQLDGQKPVIAGPTTVSKPTTATRPALSSTASKIQRKKSLSSKTARFGAQTPSQAASTQKVCFQTPQVSILPIESPRRRSTHTQNSVSAGSTPYRPRLSFGALHDSDDESEALNPDQEDLFSEDGDLDLDSPNHEMQSLVPILERTIGEMHETAKATPYGKTSNAFTLGSSLPTTQPPHRLLENSTVTPSGAAHPKNLPVKFDDALHSMGKGATLLRAVSPVSGESLAESDSDEDWDTLDTLCVPTNHSELISKNLDAFMRTSALSCHQASDRGTATGSPALPRADLPPAPQSDKSTPEVRKALEQDVNIRMNDLFGLERTPSPMGGVQQNQYTPATRLTPLQTTGLTPLISAKLHLNTPSSSTVSAMHPEEGDSAKLVTEQIPMQGREDASVDMSQRRTRFASGFASPKPATPKSMLGPRNLEPGSTSKPSRFSTMRPRVGRNEMKALAGEKTGKGSLTTLSPIRTPAKLKANLGADEILVTPVRRSARKSVALRPNPVLQLQKANYAYMPNPALAEGFEDSQATLSDFRSLKEEETAVLEQLADLQIHDPQSQPNINAASIVRTSSGNMRKDDDACKTGQKQDAEGASKNPSDETVVARFEAMSLASADRQDRDKLQRSADGDNSFAFKIKQDVVTAEADKINDAQEASNQSTTPPVETSQHEVMPLGESRSGQIEINTPTSSEGVQSGSKSIASPRVSTKRKQAENKPPSETEQGSANLKKLPLETITRVTRSSLKKRISMSPTEADIRTNLRRSARHL